jgi:hypothetical protein
MSLAAASIPGTFSFTVLLSLLAILIVSSRVFFVLCKQWTTNRPVQALRDWAADRGFKTRADSALPDALQQLDSLDPQIETLMVRGPVILIRVSTVNKPAGARPIWNLLIRETQAARKPAALRPACNEKSFVDLFSLNGFPSMLPPERFVVFARQSIDARALANGSARGLLPADIGLLVHGRYITLDFSSRPFDTIEFDRMLAIADQIAPELA